MIKTLASLALLSAGMLAALPACAQTPAPAPRVEYIILEGGGPDQGPGPDAAKNIKELCAKLGPINPDSTRMYGYGVQQIRMLSRSAASVAAELNRVLDMTEQAGVPVFLHIDPFYAWGADGEKTPEEAPRLKFWNEPNMREWGEFPKDGQLPAYIPRLWFNWGPWCSPVSAVPALGSPAFVEFAREQLAQGVLEPLKKRLEKWKAEGKSYLFAGINIGWEIHFPIYKSKRMMDVKNPIVAEHPTSVRGLKMDPQIAGMQLGYASLHWMGWDEARLQAAAAKEGVSRDEKFNALCYQAIHGYMAALSKECADYGLTSDKVYTHIVALSTVENPDTFMPPIWTSVNEWATPGFTMDNKGAARYDLKRLRADIAIATGGKPVEFGVIETYFNLNEKTYVTSGQQYLTELNELFDNGARIFVVYAAFPFKGGRAPEPAFDGIRLWMQKGAPR